MSPAFPPFPMPESRRPLRRRSVAATVLAITTAGLLAGVTFAAPAASAATANPAPSAGVRRGATRLPFSISGTTSLSVDVGTGNALITDQLLTLPGVSNDVPISLSYNSSVQGSTVPSSVTGTNGSGWAISGFDERMVANADNSVTFYGPAGLTGVFTANGSAFTSPSQFQATLAGSKTAGYTLTDHASQEVLTFNASGRLTKDTDRNGNVTSYAYNTSGYPATITSSRGPTAGRTATFTVTGTKITKITQTSGTLTRNVQLQYSTNGNLRTVIDTNGSSTGFASPSGTDTAQVVTITDPFNAATTLGFTSGKVSSVDQANPASQGGTGDAITRLSFPSSTQTLVADPTTNQSQAVASVPNTTYTINSANLVTNAVDPDGNSRSATYTTLGQISTASNAAGGTTTNTYGANSGESLTSVATPGGATESAAYTNTGAKAYLPSSSTDDAGSALSYTYDANGNQNTSAQGASGPQAKVDYNTNGTPKDSSSPGATATTTYAYANSDADLTSITPPSTSSLKARAYTWDGFARLKTATDGAGDTTTYTNDPADRITTVAYSDGTTSVGYAYDKNGHVTQRTDASGTTTYTYDDLGHLLTVKNTANNNLITYTYDLAGALATVINGAGTTTYGYDAAHELTSIAYPVSGGTRTTLFANDSDGRRTDVWLQSNYNHTQYAAHESFTYDKSGRTTGVIAQTAGSATKLNETICYTAGSTPGSTCPAATGTGASSSDRSNIQWTSDSVSGESNAYTYDDHNRLTKDVITGGSNPRTYTYGYDVAGNRTSSSVTGSSPSSQSPTYNDGNQIKTTGYTYDGAGNLTTSPARTATFNAAGQQTTATVSGTSTSYTYAGTNENELVKENTSGGASYSYTYGRPDANGLPEIDSVSTGSDTGYVVHDPSGQPVMLLTNSDAVANLYVYDGLHNPVLVGSSSYNTAFALTYDPYGASTQTNTDPGNGSNVAADNPYLFGDGTQDRATGEIKFGQRFYSPTTGAWTQQDALNAPLDPGNANRYEYAASDPINIYDPTGKSCAGDIFFAGLSGFGFAASSFGLFTVPLTGGLDTFFVVGGFEASTGGLVGSIGAAIDDC